MHYRAGDLKVFVEGESMRTARTAVTAALLVAGWLVASLAQAQTQPDGAGSVQTHLRGLPPGSTPTAGCARPDRSAGPVCIRARAVPPERLKMFTPEAIFNALTNGKMQAQAGALSDPERRAAAEFASGQTFSGAEAALANSFCKSRSRRCPLAARSGGWGNGVRERALPAGRRQTHRGDLPRLKLKWAFGYANVASARAQPIVAGDRLFVASENTDVLLARSEDGLHVLDVPGGGRRALRAFRRPVQVRHCCVLR